MALAHSPGIVTDGLVFAYDMGNTKKSWKGAPTTNLLSNTNNFSAWSQIGITVTASSESAPVGSGSAFTWTCTNSTNHQLYQARTSASTSQFSVYAKMTVHRGFYLAAYNNGYAVYFDLASGTVTSTVGTGVVGTITYYQNGWWICNISVPSSAIEVHIGFLDAAYSGTSNSPWSVSTAVGTTGLISCSQFELGTFRTPYVDGARSNVQAILDHINNTTITASSLTYDSDNTFRFASGNYISCPMTKTASITFSGWAKTTVAPGSQSSMLFNAGPSGTGPDLYFSAGYMYWNIWDGGTNPIGAIPTNSNDGTYHNYVIVNDSTSTTKLYYDGELYASATYRNASLNTSLAIGGGGAGDYSWIGNISNFTIYNRILSASEVKQNFNALRGRFGI